MAMTWRNVKVYGVQYRAVGEGGGGPFQFRADGLEEHSPEVDAWVAEQVENWRHFHGNIRVRVHARAVGMLAAQKRTREDVARARAWAAEQRAAHEQAGNAQGVHETARFLGLWESESTGAAMAAARGENGWIGLETER